MSQKTVYQLLQEKGINTWEGLINLLEGKKVKVIAKASGNNYPETFTISIKKNYDAYRVNRSISAFGATMTLSDICKGKVYGGIYLQEMVLCNNTLKELKEELQELETKFNKEKEEIEEKVHILEKFDLDEFDELMFRANKVYKNLGLTSAEEFKQVYKSLL